MKNAKSWPSREKIKNILKIFWLKYNESYEQCIIRPIIKWIFWYYRNLLFSFSFFHFLYGFPLENDLEILIKSKKINFQGEIYEVPKLFRYKPKMRRMITGKTYTPIRCTYTPKLNMNGWNESKMLRWTFRWRSSGYCCCRKIVPHCRSGTGKSGSIYILSLHQIWCWNKYWDLWILSRTGWLFIRIYNFSNKEDVRYIPKKFSQI